MASSRVDIRENEIFGRSPELLSALLQDHTLSTEDSRVNIFWATDSYVELGEGYRYADRITAESVTGKNGGVIKPRAVKSRETQRRRSREMAEVFTPSWMCNKQNNLVDNAWFGRENVFNTEVDCPGGLHTWMPTEGKIAFPEGKTWRDYVAECRLEIACGEAPYIVSRYDAATGDPIPVGRRIGMLDRKMRVAGENTETPEEWFEAALSAYKSTYGYEWQGDNLVLAREALLYSFIDYHKAKFGGEPQLGLLLEVAEVVSWNVWQMDGLKGVVPGSCGTRGTVERSLFGDEEKVTVCQGCKNGDMRAHNGTYALIKDWSAKKGKGKIRFIDLIK